MHLDALKVHRLCYYTIYNQSTIQQQENPRKADAKVVTKDGEKKTIIVDLDYVEDLDDIWDQVRNIVPGVDEIENEDDLVELANA